MLRTVALGAAALALGLAAFRSVSSVIGSQGGRHREADKSKEADKSEAIRLLAAADDRRLTAVVLSLLTAVEQISEAFRRTSTCETVNSQNAFGDEQLNVDILSNTLIFEHLASTKLVATASSEETPQETPLGGEGFSVAFDPLDGSSIVASNFTVGTIAGVWAGDKLVGQKSRNLKAVVGR